MEERHIPYTDENEKLAPPENLHPLDSRLVERFVQDIKRTFEENNESYTQSDARKSIDVSKLLESCASYSIDIEGYKEVPSDESDLEPTFQELLMKHIETKGLSNVEFYKAAWIDRKLFSSIKLNKYYQPKKETAVACCFGLGLSLEESKELLNAAGYSLSKSILWDSVVRYCLENNIRRIEVVNLILDEVGENCLGY